MKHPDQQRRNLMKGILGAAAVQGFPHAALAQTGPRIRLEWQQFKRTSQYQSFRNAIRAMRQHPTRTSMASLEFWVNSHVAYCPHGGMPVTAQLDRRNYFIAWHRGYLSFFEQQLRLASGDPTLNLPYWDYYSYPTIPSEFTDPSPDNPLYVARAGTNVYGALSLTPFTSGLRNFELGRTNAFEPMLEDRPHNKVHELIGGVMAIMQSPLDPIFYLHHANIDRLTHAWALPDGKNIPGTANPYSSTNSSPYWAGHHIYGTQLRMERYRTYYPGWLGYDYANTSVPTVLPSPTATQALAKTTDLASSGPSRRRPPFKQFARAPGRQISAARRSLGGVAQVDFDEQSYSTSLKFSKKDAAEAAAIIAARRSGNDGTARVGSIKLVVDGPRLSALGRNGGYFYDLYLNMPAVVDSDNTGDTSYVGALGAFKIAAASHHGRATIEYDLTGLLLRQEGVDFSDLSLSWVRVNGDSPPVGKMIHVPEARIDLSYEAAPVELPPDEYPREYR